MATQVTRTGGQHLVAALKAHGVCHVFCVPGESYLAVLDALYDENIGVTVCRQEGGAAMMADAYARITGRVGVVMVTRGPGATNASAGVHIAFQDSVPILILIGQVARDQRDREAFQELDYRRVYGGLTKWTAEIDQADRVPEYMARAFATATQGRMGPVALALPEDMLRDTVTAAELPPAGWMPAGGAARAADMDELQRRLMAADRPLMILGGTGWTDDARASLTAFAERWDLPVVCSFRRQDLFDNRHHLYAGHMGIGIDPDLKAAIAASDLLVVVGARLGEMTTQGYSLPVPPLAPQPLIHVHPDGQEVGRVYRPTLGILSDLSAFAGQLDALNPAFDAAPWHTWTLARRAAVDAWSVPAYTSPGDVQMGQIVQHLTRVLPQDAIIANGAGNYTAWVHRFYPYGLPRTQLAPTSGSMGYGLPAAVAAKRAAPDRTVVAFAGDGCFMMHGQEFATAVQYDLPIVVIVVNNGLYGTIRMHQEREYPGRPIATTLKNPDFAAYARAFGGHGETVTKTQQFAPAFERAQASGLPAIIEVRIDPRALKP